MNRPSDISEPWPVPPIEDQIRGLDAGRHEHVAARFAERAFHKGTAEVAYGPVPSPIGELTAVVSHQGVLALAFESDDQDDVLEKVASKVSPTIVDLPSAVHEVRRNLDAYFSGVLRFWSVPIDRSLITPFQDKVLKATTKIPRGEVRTYGQIASAAGRPKGAQATGQALGANPIPIVIPCHRVVAADGSLRGYAGGLDRKEFLLNLERGESTLF